MKIIIAILAILAMAKCQTWPINGTYLGGMIFKYDQKAAWLDPQKMGHRYFWSNNFTINFNNISKTAVFKIDTDRSPLEHVTNLTNVTLYYNRVSIQCSNVYWYINTAGDVKIDDTFSNTTNLTDNLFLPVTKRDLD